MCVSPMEVSCDPYSIINSQGMSKIEYTIYSNKNLFWNSFIIVTPHVYEYQAPVTTPIYTRMKFFIKIENFNLTISYS